MLILCLLRFLFFILKLSWVFLFVVVVAVVHDAGAAAVAAAIVVCCCRTFYQNLIKK